MQKWILLLSGLLLAGSPAYAQETTPVANRLNSYRPEALYLNLGAGGTFTPVNGFGGSTRLTAVLTNGWGLSLGFYRALIPKRQEPEEFHIAISKEPNSEPLDLFQVVALSAVRKFWVRGAREQLRLGIEAGPAFVRTVITQYTPLPPFYGAYGGPIPQYLSESISKNTPGLQVALNATYLPTQVFGLELALWGNLNAVQSIIGLEGSIALGRLRGGRNGRR